MHADLTRRRGVKPGHQSQQGGLAAARRAHNRQELLGGYLQRDVVQDEEVPVPLLSRMERLRI